MIFFADTSLEKWIKEKKFEEALDHINVEQDKVEIVTDSNMGNKQVLQPSHADEYTVVEVKKPAGNGLESSEHQCVDDVLKNVESQEKQGEKISTRSGLDTSLPPEMSTTDHIKQQKPGKPPSTGDEDIAQDKSCDQSLLGSIVEEVGKTNSSNLGSVVNIPVTVQSEVLTNVQKPVVSDRNECHNRKKQVSEPSLTMREKSKKKSEQTITEVVKTRGTSSDVSKTMKGKHQESATSSTRSKTKNVTSERRVTKVTTSSVSSEPVRLRSTKGKPPERPQSLTENGFSGSSSSRSHRSSGFARNVRPFSLSADMKFSRFRRSTEEIFIERSSPRSSVRIGSSSSSSESFLSSPVSLNSGEVSPAKVEDSVFGDKPDNSSKDQPQGEEKLSKVVVKNVFSDMLSRARKISNDFQKNESVDYKQTSSLYHREYRTTSGRQYYGSSARSTVTPDRFTPRHSFFSRGAAKSESSLLFSSPTEFRKDTTDKARVAKKKERPVSTEVFTVTESFSHIQDEQCETQSNIVENSCEMGNSDEKIGKTSNGTANEDGVKVTTMGEHVDLSSVEDTVTAPLLYSSGRGSETKEKKVKRELDFESEDSKWENSAGKNQHTETASPTMDGSIEESVATSSISSQRKMQDMSLVSRETTKELVSCEAVSVCCSSPMTDDSNKISNEDRHEKTILISDGTSVSQNSMEDNSEELALNGSVLDDVNNNKGNEISDETYRDEKEIVLNNTTSFELEDEYDVQVLVSSEVVEDVSYSEPVLPSGNDIVNDMIKAEISNKNSDIGEGSLFCDEAQAVAEKPATSDTTMAKTQLESNELFESSMPSHDQQNVTANSETPNKSSILEADLPASANESKGATEESTASEKSRARPRLGSTKSYKSFEASFDGEDYIVVDLPSGSSASDDECGNDGHVINESEINEVSENVMDNPKEEKSEMAEISGDVQLLEGISEKKDNAMDTPKHQQEDISGNSTTNTTGSSEAQESLMHVTESPIPEKDYLPDNCVDVQEESSSTGRLLDQQAQSNGNRTLNYEKSQNKHYEKYNSDENTDIPDTVDKEHGSRENNTELDINCETGVITENDSKELSCNSEVHLPQERCYDKTTQNNLSKSSLNSVDDNTDDVDGLSEKPKTLDVSDSEQDDRLQEVDIKQETEELLLCLTPDIQSSCAQVDIVQPEITAYDNDDQPKDDRLSRDAVNDNCHDSQSSVGTTVIGELTCEKVNGQDNTKDTSNINEFLTENPISVDQILAGENAGNTYSGNKSQEMRQNTERSDNLYEEDRQSLPSYIEDSTGNNPEQGSELAMNDPEATGVSCFDQHSTRPLAGVTPYEENSESSTSANSFEKTDCKEAIENGSKMDNECDSDVLSIVDQSNPAVCSGAKVNIQQDIQNSDIFSGDQLNICDHITEATETASPTVISERNLIEDATLTGSDTNLPATYNEEISSVKDQHALSSYCRKQKLLSEDTVMPTENMVDSVNQESLDHTIPDTDSSTFQESHCSPDCDSSELSSLQRTELEESTKKKARVKSKQKGSSGCENVIQSRGPDKSEGSNSPFKPDDSNTLMVEKTNCEISYASVVKSGKSKDLLSVGGDTKGVKTRMCQDSAIKTVQENNLVPEEEDTDGLEPNKIENTENMQTKEDQIPEVEPDYTEDTESVEKAEEYIDTKERDTEPEEVRMKDTTKTCNKTSLKKAQKSTVKQRKGKGKGNKGGKRKNDQWKVPVESPDSK